jgi:hypothetical protein
LKFQEEYKNKLLNPNENKDIQIESTREIGCIYCHKVVVDIKKHQRSKTCLDFQEKYKNKVLLKNNEIKSNIT